MTHNILLTGCSGGGKSTLLAALQQRGHHTIPEPGRRIVNDPDAQQDLPWVDMARFARRALAMGLEDLAQTRDALGYVFFDRGVVDAAVALHHVADVALHTSLGPTRTYAKTVFVAPPWPRIYSRDADRRHDLPAAIAEYDRITAALSDLGYHSYVLPKGTVQQRVDFVLRILSRTHPLPDSPNAI